MHNIQCVITFCTQREYQYFVFYIHFLHKIIDLSNNSYWFRAIICLVWLFLTHSWPGGFHQSKRPSPASRSCLGTSGCTQWSWVSLWKDQVSKELSNFHMLCIQKNGWAPYPITWMWSDIQSFVPWVGIYGVKLLPWWGSLPCSALMFWNLKASVAFICKT